MEKFGRVMQKKISIFESHNPIVFLMIQVEIIPNPNLKFDLTEDDRNRYRKSFEREYAPLLNQIIQEGVIFTISRTRGELSVGFKNGSPELREKLYRVAFRKFAPYLIEEMIAGLKAKGYI